MKVGGRDVRDYDLSALRDAVSVVLQKNVLFSGTIKENMRWGNPEATDEQIVRACKLAQADEFSPAAAPAATDYGHRARRHQTSPAARSSACASHARS